MTQDKQGVAVERDDIDAVEKALAVLNENGFDIASPRDGDLDDLEQERFNAIADACRAYSADAIASLRALLAAADEHISRQDKGIAEMVDERDDLRRKYEVERSLNLPVRELQVENEAFRAEVERLERERDSWEKHATTGDSVLERTRAKLESAERRLSAQEGQAVAVKVSDLDAWRHEWLEVNNPQDGTDCVTPFDHYLYTHPAPAGDVELAARIESELPGLFWEPNERGTLGTLRVRAHATGLGEVIARNVSMEHGKLIVAALLASRHLPEGPTHRHVKRGSEYVLLGYGRMQASGWYRDVATVPGHSVCEPIDMREVAIYRSVDDGSYWVRPREEFEDGRFIPLSASNKGGEDV